jgi:hypothetical protein
MFRIRSEFSAIFRIFRICSEFFAMFRICSEFSVMFRICSEFSVLFRIWWEFLVIFRIFRFFSEYLAQKLICSESLDFVVKVLLLESLLCWWAELRIMLRHLNRRGLNGITWALLAVYNLQCIIRFSLALMLSSVKTMASSRFGN